MPEFVSIPVDLKERSYTIYVKENILPELPGYLKKCKANNQVAIILAPPVSAHYLKPVLNSFDNNWNVIYYEVADGEKSKSIDVAQKIYTWLIENHFERNSTIIPLGGGVVGDLGGFVAATYLRGVNLVHLPTSLLAQVDSSIGGKVGVNHELGKNLIGAFYQPRFILSDISVLSTLPEEEFICGLGEVVKYGIIYDQNLFFLLEENLDKIFKRNSGLIFEVIKICAKIKAEVVSQDERESGLRAILNFGHTFGHALETYYGYLGLKHGQAVILGIKCAVAASEILKIVQPESAIRIKNLIDRFNIQLPQKTNLFSPRELVQIMRTDKKVKQNKIVLVLVKDIGDVIQIPVDDESLLEKSFAVLE